MKGDSYMVKMPDEKTLDKMEALLNIASDYTRLKILYSISEGEKNVTEIVNESGASQSLVSHQLKVLRKSNLVATKKEGTKVFYRLADDHVIQLLKIVHEHVSEKR
ncbi:MAG: metalloregulator ArsR/SmtB family transcription factor [Bacilli bacterium]|nr:metalloregulator ArsR/SmtB family transcription factor [Bacilli bacterium]